MTAAPTFDQAIARVPVRAFQWITVAVCALVLVSDGVDMQLLGIVAPLVIADFGVERGAFGIAMSAALVGFGIGAWSGGWLGDRIGRRYGLALAALIFASATIGASHAHGIWTLAMWRVIGGLGFGAAYSNTLAMASEWLPERLRPVVVSTLSVGTPVGGTIAGWLGPGLAAAYGWRGAFVVFGASTLLLVAIVLVALRDSPSFLLARGRPRQATLAARRVIGREIELSPEQGAATADAAAAIGILHRSNRRLNIGVGIAFAACATVAYGILNWSTTFLTAAGFSLPQAAAAVSVAGITSMIGSIAAGLFTRWLGSRRVLIGIGAMLLVLLVILATVLETLVGTPEAGQRALIVALIGAAAALFSAGIATMYIIMALSYPQSCRSAGIGFGIFMSRIGAIAASGLGGTLLDLGHGSVVPFFAVLSGGSVLVAAAALVIDRHVHPAGQAASPTA